MARRVMKRAAPAARIRSSVAPESEWGPLGRGWATGAGPERSREEARHAREGEANAPKRP